MSFHWLNRSVGRGGFVDIGVYLGAALVGVHLSRWDGGFGEPEMYDC